MTLANLVCGEEPAAHRNGTRHGSESANLPMTERATRHVKGQDINELLLGNRASRCANGREIRGTATIDRQSNSRCRRYG